VPNRAQPCPTVPNRAQLCPNRAQPQAAQGGPLRRAGGCDGGKASGAEETAEEEGEEGEGAGEGRLSAAADPLAHDRCAGERRGSYLQPETPVLRW
jgi:hypothetical protein